MKLSDYLSQQTILPELQAGEKNKAIAEIGELLSPVDAMGDYDVFLGAVFSREMEGSTGIGGEVAIPHARTDSVRDLVAGMGRSSGGIDFQAVDGRPVRLVILMGIPTAKVKAYLKLLAHISVLIKQKDFTQRLLEAPDAGAMLEIVRSFEQ